MKPNDWWPFAEWTDCARCHHPVRTSEAVAVVNAGIWAGWAHPEACPE